MSIFNYLILLLTSYITIIIMTLAYGRIDGKKITITFKGVLSLLIGGAIIVYNAYNSDSTLKIVIVLMTLILTSYFSFKDSISKTIVNTLICYFIMLLYEVIISILVMQINIFDMNTFNNNVLIKLLFSFINVSLVYLTIGFNRIKRVINSINNKIDNNKIIIIIFSVVITVLVGLDFRFFTTFSNRIYLTNIMIIICLLLLISISLYNYIKASNEMKKTEALLNFMSKYEKTIERDRIIRHETLNNLLFLKSYDDKNTVEYNNALDDLISSYNKKGMNIKNIYKLPTGLKGIFYYKLNGLSDNGFNISINVSKNIQSSFKTINHEDYVVLYKMVSILLDNAIEASTKTKDKIINIDVYKEDNKIIIIIDNSFKGKVNIERINDKNYSTKGKNRGLGLFILNDLVRNSAAIEFEQNILDKIFSSKITINKKRTNE